ncbi:MAG: TfoX/Sxy family DNA transformation protein, partial [Inhella sp.]|nr:TfoX/Sxy family DNA transformation protein [Inhella sp.]
GLPVSLNLLYALIGAVEDRDWREVQREQRSAILLRLDDMGLAPR